MNPFKMKCIKSNNPAEIIEATRQYFWLDFEEQHQDDLFGEHADNLPEKVLEARTIKLKKDFDKEMELPLYKLCSILSDYKKSKNVLQGELDNLNIFAQKYANTDLDLIDYRRRSLKTCLDEKENNNIGENFLLCLHPRRLYNLHGRWYNLHPWNTEEELKAAIITNLNYYDTLDQWSVGEKFQPEKILDSKSWELIKDLNIPLHDIISHWDMEQIPDSYADGELVPKTTFADYLKSNPGYVD